MASKDLPLEMLPPDAAAFAGGDDGVVVADPEGPAQWDDRGRPRWTVVLAAACVLGLVVAGVIAAAPWSGEESSTPTTTIAPSPSTTGPATTIPARTSGPEAATGFVVGPDQRLALGVVEGRTPSPLSDEFAVWATSDATRYSGVGSPVGRWVIIVSATSEGGWEDTWYGASRTEVNGAPALRDVAPDGVVRMAYSTFGGQRVIGSWYGLSDEEEAAVLRVTYVDPALAGTPDPMISLGDLTSRNGVLGDLTVRLHAPLGYGGLTDELFGPTLTRTGWFVSDTGGWVDVTSHPRSAAAGFAIELFLDVPEAVEELSLVEQRTLDELARNGRVARVRTIRDGPRVGSVVWTEGDRLVVVSGYNVELGRLIEIAGSVENTTPTEWTDVRAAASRDELDPFAGAVPMPPPVTITAVTMDGDADFDVRVAVQEGTISVSRFNSGFGATLPDNATAGMPSIGVWARSSHYVIVATIHDRFEGATLEVKLDDSRALLVPLEAVDGSSLLAVAVSVESLGPGTIHLRDAQGGGLSWEPFG
jgi:hypothetical protein